MNLSVVLSELVLFVVFVFDICMFILVFLVSFF